VLLIGPIVLQLASEHADRNLVTLDYTTATAVLQTDGTILCSPQVFDNCGTCSLLSTPEVVSFST